MKITNILVAGHYEDVFRKHFSSTNLYKLRFIPVDEITDEDFDWADAYVGFMPTPQFQLSKLKWVHSFNAGVNNFLEIDGWIENGVLLTRTICSFGQRISEYCLSYVLKELQHQKFFEEKQREKKWVRKPPIMIKEQTIVIFGTGEIGQEVARTFTQFGATVYGVSRSGEQKEYFQSVTTTFDASKVLSKADWVISTLPFTKETDNLFNKELFNHFNHAAFINVGRGKTVDEIALIDALNKGKIRHAVLDVVAVEPLPSDSPLWERKDVTITPHISAITDLDEAVTCFIETLHQIEQDIVPPNKVDVKKGY
ncbi:D-2-hydroxyacid dehydrogenase [Calidifontibacillus erzurumensis]|uniref:D-2-hydroxyacid dehydrogenase n=1 Tax=Calidifontibacillus erzurumensis TaxID=2741433 RepID=UPI0035B561B1